MHINVLERKAILFGFRSFCDHIYGSSIKILSDNTTAVHCIDKITKPIWDWTIKRKLWLSSAHILDRLNREADEESRKTDLRIEWKLNKTIFHKMLEYFHYYSEINLFASKLNAQLLRFFLYRPDPFCRSNKCFLGIVGR